MLLFLQARPKSNQKGAFFAKKAQTNHAKPGGPGV